MTRPFVFGPSFQTNVHAPGRPFEACYRAWRVEAGERRTSTGRLCRDSFGRLRVDVEMHGVLVASVISDPVAYRRSWLNHIEREYGESHLDFDNAVRWAMPGPGAERRTIHGLECLLIERGDRLQAWLSPELDLVVQEHVKDDSGEGIWELYDVVLREPDAKLFDVPEDYRRTV
jgi:hypothetical protein